MACRLGPEAGVWAATGCLGVARVFPCGPLGLGVLLSAPCLRSCRARDAAGGLGMGLPVRWSRWAAFGHSPGSRVPADGSNSTLGAVVAGGWLVRRSGFPRTCSPSEGIPFMSKEPW